VSHRFGCLAAIAAFPLIAGCAATGVTLRSHHFRLAVPPGWQVVEAGGGGEIPTLVRAPAEGAYPEVDVRLYSWVVPERPADPSGDVLARLAGMNVLDLASARSDDADPCPYRAAQFFVFGKPARGIHLTNTEGRSVAVTAGESRGSLVALVGALAPGVSGCPAGARMDAVIERLAASLTGGDDVGRPPVQPVETEDMRTGRPIQIPPADPGPPP